MGVPGISLRLRVPGFHLKAGGPWDQFGAEDPWISPQGWRPLGLTLRLEMPQGHLGVSGVTLELSVAGSFPGGEGPCGHLRAEGPWISPCGHGPRISPSSSPSACQPLLLTWKHSPRHRGSSQDTGRMRKPKARNLAR